jgi:hypothetical protein
MKSLLCFVPISVIFGLVLLVACGGSATVEPIIEPTVGPTVGPTDEPATGPTIELDTGAPVTVVPIVSGQIVQVTLKNHGGAMEGHTPRGFRGMGTGLFAGDNLNRNFPEGDGVQIFLSFDLSGLSPGQVQSAVLRSADASITGTPFKDLGALKAVEVRYSEFSSALWNLEPLANGATCTLAETATGPFECDHSQAVQNSLDDSYPYAQFRLRMDQAGDLDGDQDLVAFFKGDSNTNEPGIFLLDITVGP